MITRRFLPQWAAAATAYSAPGFQAAHAENAPGVTNTEIRPPVVRGDTAPSAPTPAHGSPGASMPLPPDKDRR